MICCGVICETVQMFPVLVQIRIDATASAPRSWSEMNYTAASMRWLSLHCRSRPSLLTLPCKVPDSHSVGSLAMKLYAFIVPFVQRT